MTRTSLLVAGALALLACSCSDDEREGSRSADAGSDAGTGAGASEVGALCEPAAVPPGGFSSTDVFVETASAACEKACVVYQLEGDPRSDCTSDCSDPAEAARRLFCTCRCDGPAGEEPFCECPAGFRCESVIDSELADPAVRGSYCIRDEL